MSERDSIIKQEHHEGNFVYAVELYENDELKETRLLHGKSIHYAKDVARRWNEGHINLKE